jgi:septum formation protein
MLILASASPTRAEILAAHGIPFLQRVTAADEESIAAATPKSFVYRATRLKMLHALEAFGSDAQILCADTVVTAQGELLRKAATPDEARRTLLMQSGSETAILTCTIYRTPRLEFIDLSATVYDFAPFDTADMEAYLAGGEWEGKAGACMVEGFCQPYIREVRGLESCAMGLTIEKLLPFLEA